ncbi:hypothetical protein DIU31_031855 [Mucilaginibacter rubeus]|uniref:BRCT domain-containing protein n=1 Tax=Mucilaginibacter rubeus TaxID=2027860 RepID=A0AAE6JM53_9SPHI|nr:MULTISPECIES: hypothetical protein [Mucilaginibacter]QEM07876.1 hypothetical protein DIU31_031855 [Mucilaginibacter rubeus]QEM20328.1 hypothetical protein DIU38_031460 [Mucilaginibacter gossypii]QTE42953.1 hypothetical protein J3L19_29200 [Mucilaginibacter rubeus]QTE49554.1 hypothetical protein J3L21_29160 [Mucilaginibacter rubeus]QTE54650.1 hypothetical protein J3L23_20785 [Mucilaginibacter rubeus]
MNFNRKLVINYSRVYGENKAINAESLSALNKVTWSKVLARLNYLARHHKHDGIIDVINDWFSKDNRDHANQLLNLIVNGYKDTNVHPRELLTINLWSNLHLLDEILSTQNDPEKHLDNNESEKELFDIYLAVNGLFGSKTDGIFDSVPANEYPEVVDRLARVTLTNLLPYHDLNHFKPLELLVAGTIKAYYLFSFLEPEHGELLALFLKPYGIDNWRDYLKGILPIAAHATSEGDGSGLNYMNIEHSENKDQSKAFLDHLALVDETEYQVKTDFLNARAKPLFRTGEDNYLILDSVLLVNRIYNSIFFELLRLAERNKKLHASYKDFFGLYTYDFIEKYLSYTLLDKIFGKTSYYRLSGKQIKDKFGLDTEPDYYVRNGHKVFLFEVKGSMLTGEAKQSFHFPTIANELWQKYVHDDKDEGNKAVQQLAERIDYLFSENEGYDKNRHPDKLRIYPVLIVSELALTAPGINVVLNDWFQNEISKRDRLHHNRYRIFPLVIIDLDTLILYSEAFELNRGMFEASLGGYFAAIDRGKIKPKKGVPPTTGYIEDLMMRSYQPYNGFLHDFKKLTTPKLFMEFGTELVSPQKK